MIGFNAVTDSDSRPIILIDPDYTVLACNPAARRAIANLNNGVSLLDVSADTPAKLTSYLSQCFSTPGPLPAALQFQHSSGQPVIWRCDGGIALPPTHDEGTVVILRLRSRIDANAGFVAVKEKLDSLNRELEHRKKLQHDLEEALRQKEILLAEVNHRVKNNLQVILGMLSLASHESDSATAFQCTKQRVLAIGKVHELLYESNNFTEVDCERLLSALTSSLQNIYRRDDIRIGITCSPLSLSADRATSVALIVNELLSNAFKHAFNGSGGEVSLRCESEKHGLTVISVADDGAPMPPAPTTGTGLTISRALARKLGGELRLSPNPKSIQILFPTNLS